MLVGTLCLKGKGMITYINSKCEVLYLLENF